MSERIKPRLCRYSSVTLKLQFSQIDVKVHNHCRRTVLRMQAGITKRREHLK